MSHCSDGRGSFVYSVPDSGCVCLSVSVALLMQRISHCKPGIVG